MQILKVVLMVTMIMDTTTIIKVSLLTLTGLIGN